MKGYNYFLDVVITQLGNRAGLISSELGSKYYENQWRQVDSLLDLLSHIHEIDYSEEKHKLTRLKADLIVAMNQLREIENRA